jgi:membrane associated rhomboid family serine protease
MIPLHDENPTSGVAWMTITLIAVNVVVFAYELALARTGALTGFVQQWAFVPPRFFASPLALREIATIFIAMFLHGGILHIGGNMLYLWIFGNNIEDRLGPLRFLAFYLLAGIAATVGQGLMDPSNAVPNLGASGAIAGVLGAYLLLYPRARVLTAVIIIFFIELVRIPAVIVIGLWFLLQLGTGLLSIQGVGQQSGGVAYFAHVFGFGAGALLAIPLLVSDRMRRTRFVGWR